MLRGQCGTRLGGAAAGQALDYRADVIHLLHMDGVQRRHEQPATRRVLQHALVAQQGQRLLHRLARHAERLGDLLLDDALAGAELAGSDLVEDGVAHLLHEVGGAGKQLHDAASRSRRTRCRILPVAVRGICASATKRTDWGRL